MTFDVTARGSQFENGDCLGTWSIIRYSDAYERRKTYGTRIGFISTSCVQDISFFSGFGNVESGDDADDSPTFVNPDSGDLRLQAGSSCVDAGNNFEDFDTYQAGFQFAPDTDIDGLDRITDGNGDGDEVIDMGAHELPGQ